MYKPFIVTPQSFLSKSYNRFMEIIPYLNVGKEKYKVFFFCKSKDFADIIGAERNYTALISALDKNNIEHSELPVYGFDELFYLLSTNDRFKDLLGYNGEIYCAPTNASYYISVSAGTIGYKGTLKFVLNFNSYTGKIFFKDSEYKKLAKNPRWSLVGIDKTKINYAQLADYSECYYIVDGKKYCEVPFKREHCSDKGTQAYTYVSKKSGLRLKFWEYPQFYYQFQIDKIKRMINDPSPEGMAVPKALIYSKNNIAIGIAMENFNGVEVRFEDYSQLLSLPLKFIESLIKGLVNAEAYSYIHRDFYHNILFDDDNYQAHIIDLDSVQYANYPPTAESFENRSGLPDKYAIKGKYYSTVELSYWATIMSISSVIIPNPRRGVCIIEKGVEKGHYKINRERYEELKEKAPHIADVALWQYDNCFPCHPMRLLEAVRRDFQNNDFQSVLSNVIQFLVDSQSNHEKYNRSVKKVTYDHCSFDKYRGDFVYENVDNEVSIPYIPKAKSKTKFYDIENGDKEIEESRVKRTHPEQASGSNSENRNPVHIVTSKEKFTKKTKNKGKSLNLFYKWFKIIVVKLFARSLGTVAVAIDTSLPTEELYEKQFEIFAAKKLWKKPLVTSVLIIAASVILLIVASFI